MQSSSRNYKHLTCIDKRSNFYLCTQAHDQHAHRVHYTLLWVHAPSSRRRARGFHGAHGGLCRHHYGDECRPLRLCGGRELHGAHDHRDRGYGRHGQALQS